MALSRPPSVTCGLGEQRPEGHHHVAKHEMLTAALQDATSFEKPKQVQLVHLRRQSWVSKTLADNGCDQGYAQLVPGCNMAVDIFTGSVPARLQTRCISALGKRMATTKAMSSYKRPRGKARRHTGRKYFFSPSCCVLVVVNCACLSVESSF